MNKEHLVVGCGEVGKAIMQVFDAPGVDIGNCEEYCPTFLHICFPYSEKFTKQVNEYKERYPCLYDYPFYRTGRYM